MTAARPCRQLKAAMNGFIIFEAAADASGFLREPEIESLRPVDRLTPSSRDPLIIFRELSTQEVATIREVAERLGGHVKEATRYSPT